MCRSPHMVADFVACSVSRKTFTYTVVCFTVLAVKKDVMNFTE